MDIVALLPSDQPLLWEFTGFAAHEAEGDFVKASPDLARYAQGWGRRGDFGFQAIENNVVVALCWARLFSEADRGYGWVSADIPEVSIAVRGGFQRRGIGRILMERLMEATRDRASRSYSALSLSVRADNEVAVRLYERCGFREIEGSRTANRAGSASFNMLLEL